jgi:hypothetical protein
MIRRIRAQPDHPRQQLLTYTALVVLAAATAACADLPTMPADETDGAKAHEILVARTDIAWASVEDAIGRLVPTLADAAAAEHLRIALVALQNALEDGNGDGVAEAVQAARSTIAAYDRRVGAGNPDAADLEAIRLALP